MSVQFFLEWESDELVASTNALTLTALYRQKSVGGVFISVGFTPANPITKTIEAALSPVLLDNIIYEFKTEIQCTLNGPTNNSNGIKESINFACILPVLSHSDTQTSIIVDVTGLDITKAKFTLKKVSDDSNAVSPIIVNRLVNSISATATGLTPATAYYWQINLYSTINGVEVIGTTCTPYNVTTSA